MALVGALVELFTTLVVILYNYMVAAYCLFVPPARKPIHGEIVLITGAGHGIGREFALQLSQLGAVTVLWDINKENNEKTAAEVRSGGGQAYTYVCDVRSYEDVARAAREVRRDVGDVSILVNNAGVLNGGSLLDVTEADIRRTFDVNTLAHFWTVKEFLPPMIAKQTGHIFNVVSIAGFSGTALLVDYCASKYAALGFCESLREELVLAGHKGIHVSALCPYFVTTGLVQKFEDKLQAARNAHDTVVTAVDGLLRNQQLIFSPPSMWLSTRIGLLFPRTTNQYMKLKAGASIYEQYSKRQ
ncbi:17-beta-hydroxysteroid dehydrogenase 13 [Aplysia californica]|uniref:17-beta-hydroxysteroid dehydrogenase 13 n=1 Tax=Aplysia californica TaxID=6500 RepID=A0ABM1ABQ2_APLCA|nr:17-beta-hydroxysteroid dehydrogenase 13 [Aplysia californica]